MYESESVCMCVCDTVFECVCMPSSVCVCLHFCMYECVRARVCACACSVCVSAEGVLLL